MEIQTEAKMKEVLNFLQQGNPFEAQKIISTLFESDLDSKELIFTNKCCIFWIESIKRLRNTEDSYEQNEGLLQEWKTFQSYISRDTNTYEPALDAVQHGFFTKALERFTELLEEKEPYQRAEIYKRAGICHKKLGNFDMARSFLMEANSIYPNLSSVLAELADCCSLCGEDKYGKLLFREAFYIDPESIDLSFLDSELIKCLIKITKEKKHSGQALQYWIPVYGVLNGVLNIKKELIPQEVVKLKKEIYAKESEYKDPSCNAEILVPRLLNCYFRLMDHYTLVHESSTKCNEILLKIKILDSTVYQAYIS
ncbi:MAG: hypothetical protein K5681_10900 [Treponema sp.]|nr:hypothetical protein [Treponema sp.]